MTIIDFIENAIDTAQTDGEVELRSYSGRYMYGKECIGIVGEFRDCLAVMIAAAQANEELFSVKDFIRVARDNMGFHEIWYWPHIPWEET